MAGEESEMSRDRTICIVGASRGIGAGLVREFVGRGWQVVATERSESAELREAADIERGAVEIVTCDVADPDTFGGLKSKLGEKSVDVLLLNAGITGASHQRAEQATREEIADVMLVNAFGPAHAAKELLGCVNDGGTLAFMSSLMGSIEDSSGGYDLYRTSKAAQNMLAKGIAEQNASPRGIATLSLHPGWVQTDMGGGGAPLSVEESVKGLADVMVAEREPGHIYIDHTGKLLPF